MSSPPPKKKCGSCCLKKGLIICHVAPLSFAIICSSINVLPFLYIYLITSKNIVLLS